MDTITTIGNTMRQAGWRQAGWRRADWRRAGWRQANSALSAGRAVECRRLEPMSRICGREDSNFHRVSPTSTSSLRVYHFATTASRRRRYSR